MFRQGEQTVQQAMTGFGDPGTLDPGPEDDDPGPDDDDPGPDDDDPEPEDDGDDKESSQNQRRKILSTSMV